MSDQLTARLALNCSSVLGQFDTPTKLGRARAAGYSAVEFWWPFADGEPKQSEVDRFVAQVLESGLQVVLLNFYDGGRAVGSKGLASVPGREQQFFDIACRAVEVGSQLGVHAYNPMYGLTTRGIEPADQATVAIQNLGLVAPVVERTGAVLVIEALSAIERYPLRTGKDALEVVDGVRDAGYPNIGVLADLYHLSENGDDVEAFLRFAWKDIRHMQVADAPGRTMPGKGRLPLARWIAQARTFGYTGWVGIEYLAGDVNERVRGPLELSI